MISKKKHPTFRVPNYGAKNRKGVKQRWRKQRGIDNKVRIDKKGHGATPKIGYKNSDEVRFTRWDGTLEVLVHNEKELLSVTKEQNRVAVLAHDISRRKKIILQKVARNNGIRVANEVKQ